MYVTVAEVSLWLGFILTFYIGVASLAGVVRKDLRMIASARRGTYALFGLLCVAAGIMIRAFVVNDFSIAYVANYSEINLNIHYKIAGLWAGNEGSLLFWILGLGGCSALAAFTNRKEKDHTFIPYTYVVLMVVMAFFYVLLLTVGNPFKLIPGGYVPADGRGLNPMLQTYGMMFHPPALLWGYVCFTIPFAFAMAALVSGELDSHWIKKTRRWTVLAWVLLSIGNILGAEWAYDELGWGGYWAWDPVENASFIPWLVGSAFLHSVMIQERRDMLKVWNMALIVLTFILTIFGTYLVRSGVLQSVHDFGASEMGLPFIVFMGAVAIISTCLIMYRYKELRSSNNQLESLFSREATFLLNNLLLLGLALTTLVGTTFPLISELFTGNKVTMRLPFYSFANSPQFLVLLLLIGICPLIGWRKASKENLARNFIIPTLAMLAAAGWHIYSGKTHVRAVMAYSFSAFVLVTIVMEFYRGIRARGKTKGEGPVKALGALLWKNKRRYGGYIIHSGLIMVFIGATGSSVYTNERTATLNKGGTMMIEDYQLRYDKYFYKKKPNYDAAIAALTVFKDGKEIETIYPEKRFYHKFPEPTSEVGLSRSLKEDLFVVMAAFDSNSGLITLRAVVNPLINWMWLGAIVSVAGGFYVLLPDGRKRKAAT